MNWIPKKTGVLTLALALTACGGSSSGGSSTEEQVVNLSGRAAIGAPIVNAPVEARCKGGESFTSAVTTNEFGGFQGQVTNSALPCALRVTGNGDDQILHSYADSGGTVNLTPLTDLIIALSTSKPPSSWYEQGDHAGSIGNLAQAKEEFINALRSRGFNVPDTPLDPFRVSFQINDAHDRLIDAFTAAVREMDSINGYPAFVNLISSGNLEAIPSAPTGGGGGGSGGGEELTAEDLCGPSRIPAPGTVIEFTHQLYDTASGAELGVLRFRQDHLGPREFRGEETQAVLVEDLTEGVITNSEGISYLSIDPIEKVAITHGTSTLNLSNGEETLLWFEPLFKYPYALAIGEVYTQAVSQFYSTEGGPATLLFEMESTIEFLGTEIVTVPAGTFEACKYYGTTRLSYDSEPTTIATWLIQGNIIDAKTAIVEDGVEKTETELLTFLVDGVQQLPTQ